jgi:murein DD-endopeptidase MepM/ murein hydrolase activator NlpD
VRFFNPWPEPYTVNARSPFGPRASHPITGKSTFHHGVDVACPVGTPLIAGADGTVAHKGNGASGGHVLILRHAGNYHTVYYHLKEPSHLNLGERVKAGDIVAMSGNSGQSTGPHLHFEVRRSRQWGDTVDPEPLLKGTYRARPQRPSRVGRVTPGLESLSNSWIARGAHAIRRGLGR